MNSARTRKDAITRGESAESALSAIGELQQAKRPSGQPTRHRSKPYMVKNREPRKAKVIEMVRQHYSLKSAARAAKVDPSTVARWRRDDPAFLKATDDARGDAIEELKGSMFDRAMNVDGEHDERTSALIGMFFIKAHDPSFRENYKHDVNIPTMHFTLQIPRPEGFDRLESPTVPALPPVDVIDAEYSPEPSVAS